mmetsp:Transcript_825/g.727  ORF Transcript_825/g.727 Transcript_825/m.727 type:complete len:82 (+) Transcript_825:209-454(+)
MLDLSLSEPKQLTAAALKGIGTKIQTNQWKTNEDSYCSAELSLFQSETSDVIDDLTNLSQRIDPNHAYKNAKQLYGPSDIL